MKHTYSDTVGKTETFFTRNVRLITFLICITVFLAIFGPFSVFHVYEYIIEQTDTRVEMEMEDLRRLAQSPDSVRRSDLERFLGDVGNNTAEGVQYEVYQIDIGERYFLMASFEMGTGKPYYLTLTDVETQDKLDLLKEHQKLEEFLSAQIREN